MNMDIRYKKVAKGHYTADLGDGVTARVYKQDDGLWTARACNHSEYSKLRTTAVYHLTRILKREGWINKGEDDG